jgi:hypothetical protein
MCRLRGTALTRALAFAAGFLAFLAAHELEVIRWAAWFGGAHEPWFLNSGRAALATLAWVGAASGIVALFSASRPGPRGFSVALGAFVCMTAVLFLKPGGPGTIFPIVMVAGGGSIAISSVLGAWIGRVVRGVVKEQ